MGLFNTVVFKCPKCGNTIEEQTKSGECTLRAVSSESVPIEDVPGLSERLYCNGCHSTFEIDGAKYISLKLREVQPQ